MALDSEWAQPQGRHGTLHCTGLGRTGSQVVKWALGHLGKADVARGTALDHNHLAA